MPSGYKPGFQRAELRSWDSVLLQAICKLPLNRRSNSSSAFRECSHTSVGAGRCIPIVLTANLFQVIVGQLAPPLL